MKRSNWIHVMLCFMVILAFLLSYILMVVLERFIGKLPDMFGFFTYGIIHFIILIGLISLSAKIMFHGERPGSLKLVFEAMEKIARGNFDVSIDQEVQGPYNELAESVNKMAKELGSMEQLRQDFISNVSHEFQSPLTSIRGYATLLKMKGLSQQLQLEYATIIEEESKRLSKLSENLLWLSALEEEENFITKIPFRLDRQIEDVILLLEPQWKAKNVIPETALPKICVSGSEDLLKQVWINLLVNAIKFTPVNGEIIVSLKQDSKNVVFMIFDNGIGISQSDQVHIFERFYKVDKSRDRSLGGNGLGLALVKKIVTIHGGTVTVESALGKGTKFLVVLPNA